MSCFLFYIFIFSWLFLLSEGTPHLVFFLFLFLSPLFCFFSKWGSGTPPRKANELFFLFAEVRGTNFEKSERGQQSSYPNLSLTNACISSSCPRSSTKFLASHPQLRAVPFQGESREPRRGSQRAEPDMESWLQGLGSFLSTDMDPQPASQASVQFHARPVS